MEKVNAMSVEDMLKGKHGHGPISLLNLPAAIPQMATLDAHKAANTFEVRDVKNEKVECTVNKDHVKCRCRC